MVFEFLKNKEPLPEHHIPINLDQLDNILTVLRYWYGIEVDRWLNSEASRYTVIMKINNFRKSGDLKRLQEYFLAAVEEARKLEGSKDPLDMMDFHGTFSDFLGVEVNRLEGISGTRGKDTLDVRRLIPACRVHYPLKNWFFFTDEKRYYNCNIRITLAFEPFGTEGSENSATLKLKPLGEEALAITGFETVVKNFDHNFGFLMDGVKALEGFDRQLSEQHKSDSRPVLSPLESGWFTLKCRDENEAMILNGVNRNLDIPSHFNGSMVKFKVEEIDIPGLVSYVRAGISHYIFKSTDEDEPVSPLTESSATAVDGNWFKSKKKPEERPGKKLFSLRKSGEVEIKKPVKKADSPDTKLLGKLRWKKIRPGKDDEKAGQEDTE